MGFLDAGYALFEYTGQKLLDFYDIISSAPAIVKIFQNPNTKKSRRKEKGLAGRFLTPKRGIIKSSKSHKHSKRDAHILVTPRTPKLSLASTPSIKSTPSQPVPIPVTAPTPAPEKIQKLESELTKLREEIAKLMQTPKAGSQQTGGVSGTVSFPAQTPTPQSFVPSTPATPVIATSSAAPPPPPPPPPPATLETTPKLVRSVSTIEQGATPSTPKKEMQKSMSLADVLKGASAANLRKTDLSRSPGGTPLDTPNKSNTRLNDPQDFIAQALKKKFASINKFNTPEASQKRKQVDGDSGWDESPPPSPGRNRKYTPIAFVQDENVPPVENVRA